MILLKNPKTSLIYLLICCFVIIQCPFFNFKKASCETTAEISGTEGISRDGSGLYAYEKPPNASDVSTDKPFSVSQGLEIGLYFYKKTRMTLRDFIKQVVKKNEDILSQYLEYKISTEAIKAEKSVFEPEFLTSYQYDSQKAKYTREEQRSSFSLFTGELDERFQKNKNYNTAVEGRIPTGASVRLGYEATASREPSLDETDQYKSFVGIEMSQPLLKGGGRAITTKIDVAKADSFIGFQAYRQKMMQVVLNAAATCWDYYGAWERLAIRRDSVKIAEQILKDNRERAKLGKMAGTEVLEAEAGLAKRRSLQIKAKQDLITAINNLRSYISSTELEVEIEIDLKGYLDIKDFTPLIDSSIKRALLYRPEYLSAKRKIERENIMVSYAKNQRWPQLDLKGSYGLNGLGESIRDSWDDMYDGDYRTWSVGVVLTFPLLGGMRTKSELSSALYRKRQALLELKSAEVEVANMVSTSIKNVYSTREQLEHYRNVKKLNQRLLDVELAMLEAGRSNSRSVLDKEEDLIEAREAELEGFIENKKAILLLQTAEGVLLSEYGVEVKETQI